MPREIVAVMFRDEALAISVSEPKRERWYVVHTLPHAESRAIANLTRQSFKTFCPRMHKMVRHAHKFTHTLAPLFPSYVFVRLNVRRDRWRSVNGTRGVIRILTQGELPLAVPRGVVEALNANMNSEGTVDWSKSLNVGDEVRICDGPFTGFVGALEHLDEAGRVRVLLELMTRTVSIVVRSDIVEPVV